MTDEKNEQKSYDERLKVILAEEIQKFLAESRELIVTRAHERLMTEKAAVEAGVGVE